VLQIPDTYFVASCPMRLLSPQHYSQQIHDHRGTYSTNFGNQVVFVFHKKKFQVTIPLSPSSNIGILCSAPGHQVFSCFVEDAKPPKKPPPAIFAHNVITDDEANDMELQEETESVSTAKDGEDVILRGDSAVRPPSNSTATIVRPPSNSAADSVRLPPKNTAPVGFTGGSEVRPPVDIFTKENVRLSTVPNNSVNPRGTSSEGSDEPDRPNVIPFDLLDNDQEDTNLTNQDDVTSSLDASAELMRWYLGLGHLPFANIWLMAARKEIPSWLAKCRIPKCQSCLYGKATKRPWRTKGQSGTLKEVTLPGQCVSVDQLESPVAGFIGQNKGFFFRKCYKVATIFVDHFSRLSYVYLQESTKGVQGPTIPCRQWEIC
jgi:hypothetical protein